MATSAEVPMDESTLVATSMEVQTKGLVATITTTGAAIPMEVQMEAIVATTTTEVPTDESSLVATATPAEVQRKATVGPTTTAEVPMDESSLVATPVEVQMQLILAMPTEVYRQRGNRTSRTSSHDCYALRGLYGTAEDGVNIKN